MVVDSSRPGLAPDGSRKLLRDGLLLAGGFNLHFTV